MDLKFRVYRLITLPRTMGSPGTTATEETDGAEFLVVKGAKIQEQSIYACPQASSRRRRRPICTSLSYVASNIADFVELLEVCREVEPKPWLHLPVDLQQRSEVCQVGIHLGVQVLRSISGTNEGTAGEALRAPTPMSKTYTFSPSPVLTLSPGLLCVDRGFALSKPNGALHLRPRPADP